MRGTGHWWHCKLNTADKWIAAQLNVIAVNGIHTPVPGWPTTHQLSYLPILRTALTSILILAPTLTLTYLTLTLTRTLALTLTPSLTLTLASILTHPHSSLLYWDGMGITVMRFKLELSHSKKADYGYTRADRCLIRFGLRPRSERRQLLGMRL